MTSFKANYGVGIIEYLTHVRTKAKQLLISTSKSVKEIAETCGYSDQNYFSKVFLALRNDPDGVRKQKTILR